MVAPVDTAPRGGESKPHWVIVDWLRLMEPARGQELHLGNNVEFPRHRGMTGSNPRIKNHSISLQLKKPGEENADLRVDTAPRCEETPTP